MYNNLIEEDIMILDNEFFKIDTMFETVDKMYDIKMKELEYNYIYTESINEEYIDLYTEAEEAKSKNEQGLLGRLFTAILNFIRKIRAKILRFFGNDKKASELEAKIKGNPKLANQTVEITNTTDAEKAIDEGTSFFGSLIDKIVKGTATEADADDAEEKNKSLLSRIAIFGGGALLAAGGAKVTSDKLKERGVTKQTIKEAVSNLFKREEDTKKKSNEVTQTNEQNVQKAQQAMNNNSQNGNEENTKAGRRIVASFKDFITDAGKFFTGKVSEIKSKINGVSSNNNDDNTGDNKGSSKSSGKSNNIEGKYDAIEQCLAKNDVEGLRNVIGSLCYTSMDFSSGEFDAAIKYVENKGIKLREPYNGKPELILNKKDLSECTEDDFGDAVFELKENFCTERINEVKKIGKYVYGPGGKAKKNDKTKPETQTDKPEETQSKTKPENKVEKQSETSASKEQIKNTNTQQANDKQNQKNDNKQQNQSIDYRKDFAERLLKHESIDTIPTLKTELERIIKNGKYTDEEYKRMGEIEDRLQFEMILQKVYDDRDKLNSNDQKILDTLIKKTNITANDDKELTILLNKVQDAKYNEKKRNKSNEQQPETQTDKPEETESKTKTDTIEQKKGNKINNDITIKSDITTALNGSIRNIINLLKVTSNIDKNHPPKNVNVYGMKRGKREVYYLLDEAHIYPVLFDHRKDNAKEYLKRIIEHADYLNKIRNNINFDELAEYTNDDDKYGLMEDLNEQYSVMNDYLDDAKKNLKEIEEYERQQKSSKTTSESSYDLVNDILTIFENSF